MDGIIDFTFFDVLIFVDGWSDGTCQTFVSIWLFGQLLQDLNPLRVKDLLFAALQIITILGQDI